MLLLLGSFIAGLLTVLAPCVLPLLPIIIGGSVTGNTRDRSRPVIIALSLAVSLIVFTLLLKVTTLLINVPPRAITYFSGGIIIALGLATLFPVVYATIIAKLGIESRAQRLLGTGFKNKSHIVGPIITGAALGPVFSSCSPVYGYILATVLPANFAVAMTYIVAYVLGLALVLLAIGYYGQRFISRIKFASNPRGLFQRTLAVIFILVGVMVATGYGTKIQTYVSEHTIFNFDALSAKFLPAGQKIDETKLFNVTPYDAPELVGLQNWINSQPLTLAGLKGKVVLVDFWTYSCINCIRSVPYVQNWYSNYKDSGLVVLGIHAPEFSFEKVPANVEKAVKDYHLTYPVAMDNDLSTWAAFQNQYWPAHYLIDQQGQVRRVHYGEGGYAETEEAIRSLLSKNGNMLPAKTMTTKGDVPPVTASQSPETYLGSKRASNYAGTPALAAAPTSIFKHPAQLSGNQWSLGGTWNVTEEKVIAKGNSSLRFNVAGKDVYVVGTSGTPAQMGVKLDGKPISETKFAGSDVSGSLVTVGAARLYRLVHFPTVTNGHTLELSVPDGVELNVFTFGS